MTQPILFVTFAKLFPTSHPQTCGYNRTVAPFYYSRGMTVYAFACADTVMALLYRKEDVDLSALRSSDRLLTLPRTARTSACVTE